MNNKLLKISLLNNCYNKNNLCHNIISFSELVTLIKTKTIHKHFFRYKQVTIASYHFNTIPWPFFCAVIIRLMSYGSCYFEDIKGNQMKVTIGELIKLLFQMLKDFANRNKLIENVKVQLAEIQKSSNQNKNTLDLSKRPVYLRTDQWFGVTAGGSVGHIAGVLNNLENFSGKPVFITNDVIPTVSKDIQTFFVMPDQSFRDFRELSSISYNHICEKSSMQIIDEVIIGEVSFIYQRYSLNNYTGLALASAYKVPYVMEYNGSMIWINKNWGGKSLRYESLSQSIEDANLQIADLIVVVSKPMKDELVVRGVNPNKILVNPNGVDPEKYSPLISGQGIRERYGLTDEIVIGFIGTFGMWHGAEVLAEAFGKLLSLQPHYRKKVRLIMIGDGVTMPMVRQNLRHYKVEDYAILTGIVPQEEGPNYLAACNILASPHVPNTDGTPFFGSPTKLFEYMAMGKGIVASDLDQIGEILEHNKTAYMVDPGSVESLIQGLIKLIESPMLCEKLGSAARTEVVEHYTWEKHTSKIIEQLKYQMETNSI